MPDSEGPATAPAGQHGAPQRDHDAAPGRADSITRNTVYGLATQLTTAAFTAALTIYLVRALGPGGYGVFALALGLGTILMLASDLGLTGAAGRFIAEERADSRAVAGLVWQALALKLAIALPACAALVLLAEPLANVFDDPDLVWPLRAMALVVLAQGMFLLFRNLFVSLARVSLTWQITLIESALEVAASVALVATVGGAAAAVWGRGVGYLLGVLLAIAIAVRFLGRTAVRERSGGDVRRLVSYGGALFVVTIAYVLFEQIDVILIGAIIDTESVGIFEAPLRLTTFLSYGGMALAVGVAPRLARGREGPNVDAFVRGTRYLIILQAALLPPLLAWSEPIVDLILGSGYEDSAEVLRALVPYVFLLGIGTFITLGVNYIGEARKRVPLAIGCVLVNLVIDIILLPSMGVVGAAVGTNVAFTLYVAGHFWICKVALDIPLRPLVATLVRCLAVSGLAALAMAAFGTSSLSPLEWIAGSAAGLAVFASGLLLTREVTFSELADVRGELTGRFGGRGQ